MIWLLAYVALALVLVFRGLVPMVATWRATNPRFTHLAVGPERIQSFHQDELDQLHTWGYQDDGTYEIDFGGHAMVVHLLVREAMDRSLCSAVGAVDGSRCSRAFGTFLSGGVGWLETRVLRDMPTLPGELVQEVPGADLLELATHHHQGLDCLAAFGIGAGPVVKLDGLGMLRHQLAAARSQMRRQPLSWFVGTLLNNVRPVRKDLLVDETDLADRLRSTGLLPA